MLLLMVYKWLENMFSKIQIDVYWLKLEIRKDAA